jgi:hypothetical protein
MAFWAVALAIALIAPAPAHGADSMRCGSRLLSVEARAADLIATCGEPAYRDVWTFQQGQTRNWVSDMEEWYYNFGPSQLLRIVKLRNGRVVAIDSDGYGFVPPRDARCEPSSLVEGLSKYRLLQACGEPMTRRAFNAYKPLRGASPRYQGNGNHYHRDEYLIPVYREEWVYNFGSRYLMRRVRLENGRVSEVENGERGSDTRP